LVDHFSGGTPGEAGYRAEVAAIRRRGYEMALIDLAPDGRTVRAVLDFTGRLSADLGSSTAHHAGAQAQ
jgi:hypothetical protein